MSIFDVFSNGSFGAALNQLGCQARSAAGNLQQNTPGGLGGLLGAGAIGALLGNMLSGNVLRNAALVGAGAVAWNFYQKWANKNEQGRAASQPYETYTKQNIPGFGPDPALPAAHDPVAELVLRTMEYAARADGKIDADERRRMDAIIASMLPRSNASALAQQISQEPVDPQRIAAQAQSPEQAEDIYRLSCSVIEIDQFMEISYTTALANALGIAPERKKQLEQEAEQARQELERAISA